MKENIEFNRNIPKQQYGEIKESMKGTGSTRDQFARTSYGFPQNKKSSDALTTIKKIIYFAHFFIIALCTTYILIKYPHARYFSFTLCALIVFGYMAIWTIMVNFLFLSVGKQNWAVLFDRLFIKFFMMLWPIFAIISYAHESFLHISQVAYFSLYMCLISLVLVVYELYACTFAEHQNPQFIFEKNDLTISDELVWNQRKLYNQNIMKRNRINIDA